MNENAITKDDNPPIIPPDPGPHDHKTDIITGRTDKTGRIPGVNMIEYGDAVEFKDGYQEIIIRDPDNNADIIEEAIEEKGEDANPDAEIPPIMSPLLTKASEPTKPIIDHKEYSSNYHNGNFGLCSSLELVSG